MRFLLIPKADANTEARVAPSDRLIQEKAQNN